MSLGRLAKSVAPLFGVWTVVVVLFTVHEYLSEAADARQPSLLTVFYWSASEWYTWALLTPAVFALAFSAAQIVLAFALDQVDHSPQSREGDTSRHSWHRHLECLDMTANRTDLLQGTLDMLVMRAVADEALHGYALVHRLKLISGGRLDVPQGSLYPALHRLENQGALKAEWRTTDSGREAKFYRLTARGRKRLETEVREWEELSVAIAMILQGT